MSESSSASGSRADASETVLEFSDVSKSFRSRRGLRRVERATHAIRNLDLTLPREEIFALVGESGAGKTTAGRIALGMLRPDEGNVVFEGVDLWEGTSPGERRHLRQRMHFVLQDPYQSLHPAMKIRDIVAEPLIIGDVPSSEQPGLVEDALEEVRLTPARQFLDRYPHQLSGGQRQRVAFARALVAEPRLVVADEPVSMLDVSLQAGILDLVFALRRVHGITFVFITHDLAVARHIADRIGVLYHGRLVELGAAERLVNDPQHPYTQALLAAVEELTPPEASRGPFPPGGQPCARHGRCNPDDPDCRDAEPVLVEVAPAHLCACHLDKAAPPAQ